MKFLAKTKVKLKDYPGIPVEVKPSTPKSLKTLKNIKRYDVHPILKQILEHPTADVYDIDPSSLIIRTNRFLENEITVGLDKREIIDNFDKFEVTDKGKMQKIHISKEFIKKQMKKLGEKEKELEPEFGKKAPNGPQIRR